MTGPDDRASLRVLMVTAWPPSEEAGGVSTVIRTLAAELAPRHTVTVLVNDWQAERTAPAGQGYVRLWLATPYDPNNALAGLAAWLLRAPGLLLRLRRLLRAAAIDVVHLHFASAYQFYFRVLRLLGGPPYIVTLHGSDVANLPGWPAIDRALTRWTVRGAAAIFAVSGALGERARAAYPGAPEIRCVHNGIDLAWVARLQADAAAWTPPIEIPDRFCVLVGNVTGSKAPDVAIRAWARLGARLPDLHLVIVGEAREAWEPCRALIAELGCGDRVRMAGALPRADVIRLLGRALALVAPSRKEGFGLMLVEAGAVGLPVVCSRIGPFLEIVEDGRSALMVTPEDPEALAEAVARLAGDAGLRRRLGQALKHAVEDRFSARRMARDYEAAYRAAVGPGGR